MQKFWISLFFKTEYTKIQTICQLKLSTTKFHNRNKGSISSCSCDNTPVLQAYSWGGVNSIIQNKRQWRGRIARDTIYYLNTRKQHFYWQICQDFPGYYSQFQICENIVWGTGIHVMLLDLFNSYQTWQTIHQLAQCTGLWTRIKLEVWWYWCYETHIGHI